MTGTELDLLSRAHALFAGARGPGGPAALPAVESQLRTTRGVMESSYRTAAAVGAIELARARELDAALMRLLADAHRDHQEARERTGAVLAAARTDAAAVPANPTLARELLRRKILRLRTQRSHVRTAHRNAERHRSSLHGLRYLTRRAPGRDAVAGNAVRAAMSRLGRPYVWGATGPDRFDCSGLVQWAYGQAGLRLHRTTYEQIHDGVPIARSQVRPGDLVFPHAGHVQLAIGNGLVVEAPQPGSSVQVSRLGPSVAIRRPG